MTYAKLIGQMVARFRKERGQSAAELAQRTGISRDVIANLENGRKRDVTVSELFALAAGLEVPPLALIADLSKPLDCPNDAFAKYADNNYHLARWIRGEQGANNRTVRPDGVVWLRYYNEDKIIRLLGKLDWERLQAHLIPQRALFLSLHTSRFEWDLEDVKQSMSKQYDAAVLRNEQTRAELSELGADVPPEYEQLPSFSDLEDRLLSLLSQPDLLESMSDGLHNPFNSESIVTWVTGLETLWGSPDA